MPTLIEAHYASLAAPKPHRSEAFDCGHLAYQNGDPLDVNPYRPETGRHNDFIRGWRSACRIRPKAWPSDDSTISAEDIVNDAMALLDDAYTIERRLNDLEYRGYDLPDYMLSTCLGARAFELHQVEYSDREDECVVPYPYTVMRDILKLVSQLSFENGRRYERSEKSESLIFGRQRRIDTAVLLLTSPSDNEADRNAKIELAVDFLKNG